MQFRWKRVLIPVSIIAVIAFGFPPAANAVRDKLHQYRVQQADG